MVVCKIDLCVPVNVCVALWFTFSSSWYFMILWTGLMSRSLSWSLWPSCCFSSCIYTRTNNIRHPWLTYSVDFPYAQNNKMTYNICSIVHGTQCIQPSICTVTNKAEISNLHNKLLVPMYAFYCVNYCMLHTVSYTFFKNIAGSL